MSLNRAQRPQIVIIDDDDFVNDPICMLIELRGWSARSYKSCESFLADLRPGDAPACLILDLHFPGMNGVELQQSLVDRGICIPALALTARPDGPLAGPARDAGVLEVLTKPIRGEELLRKIESILAREYAAEATPA